MMQNFACTLLRKEKKPKIRSYSLKSSLPFPLALILLTVAWNIEAHSPTAYAKVITEESPGADLGLLSPPVAEQEVRSHPSDVSPTDSNYDRFYFQVFINNQDQKLIGEFKRAKNGEWWIGSDEANQFRIRAKKKNSDLLQLDSLPLTYRIDEQTQTIYLNIEPEHLLPKVYHQSGAPVTLRPYTPSAFAWITNYNISANGSPQGLQTDYWPIQPWNLTRWQLSGWGANFDSRLTGELGTLLQSGYISNYQFDSLRQKKNLHLKRLDTYWTYTPSEGGRTYRVGDSISSSLNWSRSIRFAGFHFDQNFENRTDLITLPLPEAVGTAAVPSIVEVYLGKKVIASQHVEAGPFQLTGLPIYMGSGQAQVVVRDISGRQVVTQVPFFVSNRLLPQKALAYAVDFGLPRMGYGSKYDLYAKRLIGNVGARYGLFKNLTVEGHIEANANLINGGVGVILGVPAFGLLTASWSHSFYQPYQPLIDLSKSQDRDSPHTHPLFNAKDRFQNGSQLALGLQTNLGPFYVTLYSQRTFGSYQDLASTVLDPRLARNSPALLKFLEKIITYPGVPLMPQPQQLGGRWTVIKQLESLSIATPAPWKGGSLGLSYSYGKDYMRHRNTHVMALTYSQALWKGANFHLSAYMDFNSRSRTHELAPRTHEFAHRDISRRKEMGIYFSLSIPLSNTIQAQTSYQSTESQQGLAFDLGSTRANEVNNLIWKVYASQRPQRYMAWANYTSPYNRLQAQIQHLPGSRTSGSASLEGSIVVGKKSLILGQSIQENFALGLVDVGLPGIDIEHQGRIVARTNAFGKALVPDLSPYVDNRISLDINKLPFNAVATSTREIVRPKPKSAVDINLLTHLNSASALIILHDSDGKPIVRGTRGLDSRNQEFIVGYDGLAFIENLKEENIVTVKQLDKECRAAFPYKPNSNPQVRIGPIRCF